MSQQHVEIVRRLYRALNARDSVRAAELTHPDIEWIPDSRVGEGPVRGRDNVARFFVDRTAMFEKLQTEVERCWDKDDQVLAFVRIRGRGRASGADVDIRIAHPWTLRDGLVERGEGYGDRREALEAAGVDE